MLADARGVCAQPKERERTAMKRNLQSAYKQGAVEKKVFVPFRKCRHPVQLLFGTFLLLLVSHTLGQQDSFSVDQRGSAWFSFGLKLPAATS